ncbi:unnamed protein product [Pleuronectes platessa]|uniref:Uncharacterized protein n=1 Tax=Pleuronectes platessa TaxID=8262 RepID=A0A9N7TZ96_PLEPL|nr:unnamed protein product [Pleuronectes platessa]
MTQIEKRIDSMLCEHIVPPCCSLLCKRCKLLCWSAAQSDRTVPPPARESWTDRVGVKNTPLMSAKSMETKSVSNGAGPVYEDKEDSLSPEDLSEVLAAGTKEVHEKAENTQFVKDFLRGRIRKELFKLGAVALYYTYKAMEEEIERNKDHPHFAPLYFPRRHYVDRIHQVGQEDPVLLVSHAYTRYMGDLSGGQVLKKVAQRALKLPTTGEGLEFYQFDAIHSAKAFKQLYRSRMNELELDMETKKRLVGEAVKAFNFNMEVFEELEEMGKTIQEDVLDAGLPVHGATGGDISKCPYYAAKMTASSGTAYAGQLVMAVLRHPTGQVLFATWIAALAGFAAC